MDVKTQKYLVSQETILVPLDKIDSQFQKSPIFTPKNWTVQPGYAVEDTAFKPGFEISKF
jgi:hypothetical protein